MTLSEIRQRILQKIGHSGDSQLNTDITYALETVQDEIIDEIDFTELLSLDTTSLLLVADQQDYNLPSDFDSMVQIWSDSAYSQELKRITPVEYKTYLPDVDSYNGTDPIYYDIIDSALSGSTYYKKIKFFPFPSDILDGTISAFADYSGTVAGTVSATNTSHGLATGDSITITSATGVYDGAYEVTKIDDDTFYFTATWSIDDAPATWIKNYYIPFVYKKSLSYLSADTDENAISYIYPQLYVEGGAYYLFRDNIYRDQPEKIAFRRSEYQRVINQVKASVQQPDKINSVLPKRLIGTVKNLYTTQYEGYTS